MHLDRRTDGRPPIGGEGEGRRPALRLVVSDGVRRPDPDAKPPDAPPRPADDAEGREEARQHRRSLVALGLVLALVVLCLWLANVLRRQGRVEDCLMARRLNCDQIVTGR